MQIEHPKQIFVEGEDEVRVFTYLAKRLSIADVQVQPYQGKDKLRDFLSTFKVLLMSDPESVRSLAVVADADTDKCKAIRRIQGALRHAELPIPEAPLEISSHNNLRVSYLIIPHEKKTGMLEDVFLEAARDDPEKARAMTCVDQYFACLAQACVPGPKETWQAKAQLHTFLASRERPDLRLGESVQRGLWNVEADVFEPLRQLLRML